MLCAHVLSASSGNSILSSSPPLLRFIFPTRILPSGSSHFFKVFFLRHLSAAYVAHSNEDKLRVRWKSGRREKEQKQRPNNSAHIPSPASFQFAKRGFLLIRIRTIQLGFLIDASHNAALFSKWGYLFRIGEKTFHIFKRIKRKEKRGNPCKKKGKENCGNPTTVFFAQRCNWHLEQYRFPCCNGTVLFLPTLLLSDSPGGTKKCARKGERPKRYLGRQIDPLHARGAIAACIGGGDSDDAKPQKFHRRRRPNDIAAGFFFFCKDQCGGIGNKVRETTASAPSISPRITY